MNLTIFKEADYRRMPWKNGLGVTCEIRREPPEEAGDFVWRVSIADIKENGPFSKFADYMRVICTLEGRGMFLTVDGVKTHPLLPYDPFVFHGASVVESELIDGPIRDFNLIYRPDLFNARMKWLNTHSSKTVESAASRLLIFTVKGVEFSCGDKAASLEPFSTLEINNAEHNNLTVKLAGPSDTPDNYCCFIEIDEIKK